MLTPRGPGFAASFGLIRSFSVWVLVRIVWNLLQRTSLAMVPLHTPAPKRDEPNLARPVLPCGFFFCNQVIDLIR
jgi:hypothetical protein